GGSLGAWSGPGCWDEIGIVVVSRHAGRIWPVGSDKVLNNGGPLLLVHLSAVDFGHFVNGSLPLMLRKERLNRDVAMRMAAHAHDEVIVTTRGDRNFRVEMREGY